MMNQGAPGPGFSGPPYDGAVKGGVNTQPFGNRGPPPSQHFPPSVQNGISHQPHMNGPTQGQFHGQFSQAIQGTPQKAGVPYQQSPHLGQSPRPQPPGPPQQQQMPPGMNQPSPRPSTMQQPSQGQPPAFSHQQQQMTQQMTGLSIGSSQQNQSGWPSSQTPGRGVPQQHPRTPPPGVQAQTFSTPGQSGVPPINRPPSNTAPPQVGPPPTGHPPASQAPPSSRPGPPSGPMMPPQPGMGAPPTSMGMRPPPMGFGAPPSSRPTSGAPPVPMGISQPSTSASGSQHYSQPSMGVFPGTQVSAVMPGSGDMPAGVPSNEHMSGQRDSFVGQAVSQAVPPVGMTGLSMNTLASGASHGRIHSGRRAYPGHNPPSPVQAVPSPNQGSPQETGMGLSAQQTGPSAYPGTGPMPGMVPGPMGAGPMGPLQPGSQQHKGMSGPSAMNSPMQQQRRIDPDQMPSPIQVMNDDIEAHRDKPFCTNMRGRVPPLVTTPFSVKDDGNCSPRFMRSTMYNVPNHQDIKTASEIPLALNVTPFADLPPTEAPLRIIDHGANGPVRCNRCRAYINPFVQFIDGGRRYTCNICTYSSEVPPEYFCHLDHQGLRVDLYERPELHCGSYEFVCTTDYCKDQKAPQPPAYVFMIDVSYQSIQCGMVRMLMRELGNLLDHLPREFDQQTSSIRVGFVTYSTALHFYNVKGNLAQPQMMVVTDMEDMFVPLLDGFLVNVQEARSVIDSLLEQIPQMFAESRDTEIVLGPVVQAGLDALKSAGICGKLFIFHSSLPIGEAPGKLKNREDRKLLGTDKEKTILSPQSNFYEKTAKQCVEAGVSVDLFLFPNAYTDVATIGGIATITGGQIYRYSYFKESTHGQQFREDLFRSIRQNVGFDAVMRIRTSTGLRPVDFIGNFYMSNTTDVELAAIDSRKAIAIEIKHDDKLADDSTAYFQCALLYTSVSGQRRLRVHNLALSTCSQLSDLFRCCEMDTFVNVISKQAVRSVYTSSPKAIREGLINQCAGILACYRRNCASPSSAGQLILPECMKLLPLYMNCVLKNDILMGGAEMSTDDRSWLMRTVMSMDQNATVPYFYPRLMSLHDVDVDGTNLPTSIRCSMERMKDNGVYLLENGIVMFLWIGLQVDPQFLQQLFGVTTISQVDIEMTNLPDFDNPLSSRVRNIISEVRSQRTLYLKLTIVRQRDKLEPWFKHFLVEDKGMDASSYSYVDFLCIMHKEIRNLLN